MLTADKLKTLIALDVNGLAAFLAKSKYKGPKFEQSKFLGITNGGQLCYQVEFSDEKLGKVFLTYDHVNDSITAEC